MDKDLTPQEQFQKNYGVFGVKANEVLGAKQVLSLSSVSNIAEKPTSPNVFANGQVGGYLESQNYKQGEDGWKLFPTGSAEFTDLFVTAFIKTVSAGGDIQTAINFLQEHGGGEVHLDSATFTMSDDIILYSGVSLIGVGTNSTIINLNGNHRIIGSNVDTINIVNLQVTGSTSSLGAIDIGDSTNIGLKELYITGNNVGVNIDNSSLILFDNSVVENNSGDGIVISNSSVLDLRGVASLTNGGNGWIFTSTDTIPFFACAAIGNSLNGFSFTACNGSSLEVAARANQGVGIIFSSACDNNTIDSSIISNNNSDGMKLTQTDDKIIISNNQIYSNAGYGINITALTDNDTLVIGNVITLNATGAVLDNGTNTLIRSNIGVADNFTTSSNPGAGVYTPVVSGESNLDATTTITEAQYLRIGNTVTVSGRFTANPTLTATSTFFELNLPVASNIGAAEDVAGVAFSGSIAGQGAAIIGVVANDTAKIIWVSADISAQTWSYHFSYQII